MRIVAVDLAAKYSAAITITDRGVVLGEIDSWNRSEADFVYHITRPWVLDDAPDALVVEDLPHGVQFMTNTKNVCRIQGRIVEAMHRNHALDSLRFITPVAWRTHFALKPGTGPEAVVNAAQAHGYAAPDLTARTVGKGAKAIARKVATDYAAAFCIGRWFLDTYTYAGSLDFPGTSRYGDISPRRPRRPTKIIKEKPGAEGP